MSKLHGNPIQTQNENRITENLAPLMKTFTL